MEQALLSWDLFIYDSNKTRCHLRCKNKAEGADVEFYSVDCFLQILFSNSSHWWNLVVAKGKHFSCSVRARVDGNLAFYQWNIFWHLKIAQHLVSANGT